MPRPPNPPTKRPFLTIAILFGALATSPFVSNAAETDPAPLTSSEAIYQLENLLKIEIFMAEDAWDKVRFSWRGEDQMEVNGKWETITSDYEHQPGDILINGVRVENVGIRKKGFFGSLSAQRPSLKVKFNKYVKGQDFLGIQDLTLNNNSQDPSQVRQHLAYEWFRRAGLPASRCNFARVFVNGKYLGIYSHVEPVGKALLKTHFGSSKGTLYESTAVDFLPRSVEHFETKTNKKSDDQSALKKVADLLADVEKVDVNELSKLIDLDQFLNFWVAEMLLGHWDGYAGNRNNFFIYQNPKTQLLEFLPWGTDQVFGDHQFLAKGAPRIVNGTGRLCAALYANPEFRGRYLSTVANRLQDWWSVPEMFAVIDRDVALIRPYVHLREQEFDEALAGLRMYVESISPQVTAELKDPPAQWPVSLPEEGLLRQTEAPSWAGSVKSSFLVPFVGYDLANQTVLENGSLEVTWRGRPVGYPVITGTAGYKHPDPGPLEVPELVIAATSPQTGRTVWIYLSIDPDLLAKGGDLRLHKSQVISWFGTTTVGKPGFIVHGSVVGTLHAELIDQDGGKYIKGTIDAHLGSGRKELEF